MNRDLFGNPIIEDVLLRDKFIEPPFSILDTKSGSWRTRKQQWLRLGMQSDLGRGANLTFNISISPVDTYRVREGKKADSVDQGTSIFDPALCEVLYHWFCPPGGRILDPFAGGSVRGVVAHYLGYQYTGIDIRPEQIDSNVQQAARIRGLQSQPRWICGDSTVVLDDIDEQFDFILSCPPYADLEKYSDLPGDISNMRYEDFLPAYETIINKSCAKLISGGHACFVVGEVRDKHGHYIGFVPDTIHAFRRAGLKFYNEAILLNQIASASVRAAGNMRSRKLVKVHQNVLVFKKP